VGLPGRIFEGTVTNIDSRIVPVTRSVTVRAVIANRDNALRPGMFMTVTLRGATTSALLIPEGAILPEQGRAFVYVVEGNVAKRREVTLGRRRPGQVEVTRGLQEGERIVIDGALNVREGGAVREQASRPATTVSP
jgi:membrane fusion protein (multidrug efflux system)